MDTDHNLVIQDICRTRLTFELQWNSEFETLSVILLSVETEHNLELLLSRLCSEMDEIVDFACMRVRKIQTINNTG